MKDGRGGTVRLGQFEFERGGNVPDLKIAYETYGEFTGSNAILVCHALTGSQTVIGSARSQGRGWWEKFVGPGKPIDTSEYFVVCANVPGSCYGSSGPSTVNPRTGKPYGVTFPPVTVGDWTRAQRLLLDRLGVDQLHAVVGGSVGGMNALDWARRYPAFVERVAPIATAARLDPQLLAINAIKRRAITGDPDWCGGDYYDTEPPRRGLALARMLGHITYLSKDSMKRRFGRDPAEPPDEDTYRTKGPVADAFEYRSVESYLDYRASQFVERFDANSYLYLTRAMDAFDLAAGRGSDAGTLAEFDGEALCVSITGDWHFTVRDGARLADAFAASGTAVAHRVVESDYGHDAFLLEPETVGPPLREFLSDGIQDAAVDRTHVAREDRPRPRDRP